jgi:hypothetical protein
MAHFSSYQARKLMIPAMIARTETKFHCRRSVPIAEPPGRPLRRRPRGGEHDGEDDKNLAPKDLGHGHDVSMGFRSHHLKGNEWYLTSPKVC